MKEFYQNMLMEIIRFDGPIDVITQSDPNGGTGSSTPIDEIEDP